MNLNTFTLLNTLLAELKIKNKKDKKIYLKNKNFQKKKKKKKLLCISSQKKKVNQNILLFRNKFVRNWW